MKELRLQDLLNMADAAAHDSICDLWNQKTIHLLVVFTSPDQDFEIIGVGPMLPYTTLAAAEAHSIPNKTPEFYVKCPAAIAGRLQPKLAPSLSRPLAPKSGNPAPIPSLKGRTTVPFVRPAQKLPPKPVSEEQGAESAEPIKPIVEPATTNDSPAASPPPPAPTLSLEEREQAVARREQELAAFDASLKIRESALLEREAALSASEERLLNPPPKTN